MYQKRYVVVVKTEYMDFLGRRALALEFRAAGDPEAMCSPFRYTLPCSRCDRPECVSEGNEFVSSVLSIASETGPPAPPKKSL